VKRLWLLLLAVVVLEGSVLGQASTRLRTQPPVTVSAVTWESNFLLTGYYSIKGSYGTTTGGTRGFNIRTMSVTVTNTGSLPIESLRIAFVFSDPDTGEEWFRSKVHSKKRLLPGESRLIEKIALPRLGYPPRDSLAAKSAVITQVKYSDGSIWRHK
jgi:hypothetical protein